MADYIEFSRQIKAKYPQYKDVDDMKLAKAMIEKYPQYKDKVTFEGGKKGINLTPSGIANTVGASIGNAITAPIVARRENIPVSQAFKEGMESYNTMRANDPLAKVQDFVTDIAGYSVLPDKGGFVGRAVLQGGIPGALESLKRGENVAQGAGVGTGIAAGVQGALAGAPYIGRVVKNVIDNSEVQKVATKVIEGLTSIPQKYSQRALDAELAGNSILKGKFDPETAYRPIEQKLKEAKAALPTKESYQTQYKLLGQEVGKQLDSKVKPSGYYDKQLNQAGKKVIDSVNKMETKAGEEIAAVLNKFDDTPVEIPGLQSDIQYLIDSYARGGNINPAEIRAGKDLELVRDMLGMNGNEPLKQIKPIDLHNAKEILYDMANYDTSGGTRNNVLKGAANNINEYLRRNYPQYQAPNDKFSLIKEIESQVGGINSSTIANKLGDYGTGSQIRSGVSEGLENLNNLLPADEQFLQGVRNINNAQRAEEELIKNIPQSIRNDISKLGNAPIDVQNAVERLAPNEVSLYRDVLEQQNLQNEMLKRINGQQYERNPRLLANRFDKGAEDSLNYLQKESGINFMDELNDIRAREAFDSLFPGQGGGSGSAQGFGNLLRTAIIGGAPTAAAITGNPASLLGLAAISPRITGQGVIRGLGNLYRLGDTLQSPISDSIRRTVTPPAVVLSEALLGE